MFTNFRRHNSRSKQTYDERKKRENVFVEMILMAATKIVISCDSIDLGKSET